MEVLILFANYILDWQCVMKEKKLHAFIEGSKLIQKLICSKEKCSGGKSAGFCSHCRTLERFYGKANSPTGIDSI